MSKNIFDNLPALQAPKPMELRGELDRYLSTDPKHVTDALAWWYEHKHVYPRLYWMAMDYLSIPGMFLSPPLEKKLMVSLIIFSSISVDVEWTFSQGQLLLSHIHNQLSVQSTQVLLCLRVWSLMGYVKDKDLKAVTILPEVGSDEEDQLANDWDTI